MRIHTSLTQDQVYAALPSGVSAYIMPKGSRKRERAFEVTLYVLEKDALHRRFGNSGGYGSRNDVAATWDEWGVWMNELYRLDPDVVIPPYEDYHDFLNQTTRYRDYVRQWNGDTSVAVRTHMAPWLESEPLSAVEEDAAHSADCAIHTVPAAECTCGKLDKLSAVER